MNADKIIPFALTALLTYLFLYFCAALNLPIYKVLITEPVKSAQILIYRATQLGENKYSPVYWSKPYSDETGVTSHNPDKSFAGYTFFSSSYKSNIFLIDMGGNIVHEWSMPHEKVWPKPDFVAQIVPQHKRIISRATLYPNGDVLAIYTGIGSNPLGYGLAKIDKDSNLLWSYEDAIHHDAEIAPDGTIYTLSHRIRNEPYRGLSEKHAAPPLYEDFLVLISAVGEKITELSFYDLFANSDYKSVLPRLKADPAANTPLGDTLHPNGIEIISRNINDILKKDHLIISFRNNSMLAVIDPANEKVTWAGYGPWRYQHDPRLLDDGSVILFDNEGHTGKHGASRILRIDPQSAEILWQYAGTQDNYFYSAFHSSVDPLPNGNVLITETLAGRMFEVSEAGDIVWEYHTPLRQDDHMPGLFRGRRYAASELEFIEN